jgi:ribosomal protein S27AE
MPMLLDSNIIIYSLLPGHEELRDFIATHLPAVSGITTVCLAMWTLIREKTDLTEDDLFDRVRELDVSDGVEDDKLTRFPRPCPACKRLMSAEHKRCIYCGLTPEHETAFDAV